MWICLQKVRIIHDWMHAVCKIIKQHRSCITARHVRTWGSQTITLYSTIMKWFLNFVSRWSETEGTILRSSFPISKSKHSRRWLPFHHQIVAIQRSWVWGSEIVISPVLQSYPCVREFVPWCNISKLTTPPVRVVAMWHLLVSLQNERTKQIMYLYNCVCRVTAGVYYKTIPTIPLTM